MKNIYANRMAKPPHHLPNSYNGTPTPPVKQRRPSLSEGLTPREKAKLMEEKRREDMRKQRELKEVSIAVRMISGRWHISGKRYLAKCPKILNTLFHTFLALFFFFYCLCLGEWQTV